METWVFLRGARRDGSKECKGSIDRTCPPPDIDLTKNGDMWTHLFARMVNKAKVNGIIFKYGNFYKVEYHKNLIEYRVTDWPIIKNIDLIISRGGYNEYIPFLQRYQNISHIYLGCGIRWNPFDRCPKGMKGLRVDGVLVDNDLQYNILKNKTNVIIFPKPAADNIFYPRQEIKKQYDLVYNCFASVSIHKGGIWLAPRIPDGCKVLVIGPENKWLEAEAKAGRISVVYTGRVPIQDVPQLVSQARVGVVCDDGMQDSGPRILPEFLAMDIPVIVRDRVRVSFEDYIKPLISGMIVGDDPAEFKMALKRLSRIKPGKVRNIYTKNLTLDKAADRFLGFINKVLRIKRG